MRRMTSGDVLSQRAVNRATLGRQLLLHRATMSAAEAIGHLVGMQAQAPNAPYVALCSRLADFDPGELATLLRERRVVRGWFQRTTVHLVTAREALALRPLTQAVAARMFAGSPFSRGVAGLDVAQLLPVGRALLEGAPPPPAELGRPLAHPVPRPDGGSLAVAGHLPVPGGQAAPRGLWGG